MPERTTAAVPQGEAFAVLEAAPGYGARMCAPDHRNPAVCASNRAVPSDLWVTPDEEGQADRHLRERAAKARCGRCPVLEACAQYAIGHETWNVWGGMTAREREKARKAAAARRSAVVERLEVTVQQAAVLRALAGHYAPAEVARAAGMDERTAAWQRARLVTLLGLDPGTATRMRLLYAARTARILPATIPMHVDRGRVVAAIPSAQAAVERAQPHQLPLPGLRYVIPTHPRDRPTTPPPPPGPGRTAPCGPLHLVPTTIGAARTLTLLETAA